MAHDIPRLMMQGMESMGLTAKGMEEMRAPTLRLGGSPARMEDVVADLLALEDWCERAAIADASGKS